MRRSAALAVALALLAACQPAPRPFAPAERNDRGPVVPAEDAFGVTLRPISGMAPRLAAGLSAALVAALEDRAVPAVLSSGRARGSLVHGVADARPLDDDRLELAIEWWVFGRDGRGRGRHRVAAEAPRADWDGAAGPPVERLAVRSAEGIVALLRGIPPHRAARPPAVGLDPPTAPPGIDGEILRRAMADTLRAAGIEVSPRGRKALKLGAAISLGPPAGGSRRLGVAWRLDDAAGRRIGAMVQENDVADATLAADWPAMVWAISRAALDDLRALLERAEVAARPVDASPGRP